MCCPGQHGRPSLQTLSQGDTCQVLREICNPHSAGFLPPGLPLADRQRGEQRQAVQHSGNGWTRKPGQQAKWQIFPVDRRQIAGDFRLPEIRPGEILLPPVPPASQGASGHVEQRANILSARCSGGQPSGHQQDHQGQIDPAPEKPHGR